MKRNVLLKTMLLLCALIVGSSSVWAEKVTFDAFKDVTGTTHTTYTNDVTTFNCDDGSTWKALGFQEKQYTWIGPGKGGSNYLETPEVDGTITSIAVTWSGNANYFLAIQTTTGTELEAKSNPSSSTTETFTVTGTYNQLRLVGRRSSGTNNALAMIEKVVVTYTPAVSYTITAQSNNTSYGTVSLSDNVITASPNDGCRYASPAYAVSPINSATVSQNGDEFTVTPSSDCTVTINFEAIPSHTLGYVISPAGGGTVVLGATSVLEGETTTATAIANADYKFKEWSITGEGATLNSTSTNPTTVTMGIADATVTATFEAVTTYEIKWSVNGTIVKTENVEEDTPINFAAPTSGVPTGYSFTGWVTEGNKIDMPTDTDPSANYVTSGNSVENITYYAVIAKVTGSTPESWTETALSDMTSSDVFVFSNGTVAMKNDGGTSGDPGKVNITVVNHEITSEVSDNIKWQVSGNATDGYTFYKNGSTDFLYCNTTSSSSNNSNLRISDPVSSRNLWVFDSNGYLKTKDNYASRYISYYEQGANFRSYLNTSNNPVVPKFYKYTAASATYGGYCTTIPPTNVTITDLSSVPGSSYTGKNYATMYYSDKAFAVPTGVVAKTYKMKSGVLIESRTYENGGTYSVIPAGEAVVVESDVAGNYSFAVSSTETTPDEDNALCGTDDAETVNAEGYKYYKLSLNNGLDKVGFFFDNTDGSAINNDAHKAYLCVATGAGAKSFYLLGEDTTTGIANLNVDDNISFDSDAPMYNLAGQRVTKAYQGVVIVNGKKMLNK